jgi:arylformamidase
MVLAQIEIADKIFTVNLKKGVDISLSFGPGGNNPNAFGIPFPEIAPIKVGDFVGSVAAGSGANCDIIRFCAHGNTTHTECIGHITKAHEFVGDLVTELFLLADVISVTLTESNGVNLITPQDLGVLPTTPAKAVVIRTTPNLEEKKSRNWSNNNPPFFSTEAMQMLVSHGYEHLLTDLPSVDAEEDGGALAAHHVWWQYPANPRMSASITELIYVPDSLVDGMYLLNLVFPRVQSDASPSRPVLFELNAK